MILAVQYVHEYMRVVCLKELRPHFFSLLPKRLPWTADNSFKVVEF